MCIFGACLIDLDLDLVKLRKDLQAESLLNECQDAFSSSKEWSHLFAWPSFLILCFRIMP